MKLRIKGNTVRLRLSMTEVKQLSETGLVTDATHFGNNVFNYEIKADEQVEKLSADFNNNTISFLINSSLAKTWKDDELVGYDAYQTAENGEKLYLLLEKDYKCLDNTNEDQSDNYENPLAAKFK